MCKKIDGASKYNNFQKKVYQKLFICQGDILLSRAKQSYTQYFPQNPQTYQWKTNENRTSRLPICIEFPLICLRILREISDFFALESKIYPRQIIFFLINFFLKLIIFGRSIDFFKQNSMYCRGNMRTRNPQPFSDFSKLIHGRSQ